jgi:hypothetical protein
MLWTSSDGAGKLTPTCESSRRGVGLLPVRWETAPLPDGTSSCSRCVLPGARRARLSDDCIRPPAALASRDRFGDEGDASIVRRRRCAGTPRASSLLASRDCFEHGAVALAHDERVAEVVRKGKPPRAAVGPQHTSVCICTVGLLGRDHHCPTCSAAAASPETRATRSRRQRQRDSWCARPPYRVGELNRGMRRGALRRRLATGGTTRPLQERS